jgi:hypothetical protein
MISQSMRRPANRTVLTDEVARFQAEVQRLAISAAHAILQQELDRRLAKLKPARSRSQKPDRTDTTAVASSVIPVARVPAAAAPATEAPATEAPATEALAPEAPREQPPDRPTGRKRIPWTREAIINELASWMLSGTAIDATFVTRHGPPGLVAATRRIFGRFDAALNVAGLHVSKLYPDGPPARTVG